MKFKISISAEVDFTEMLLPENVEGAKLALGADSEAKLIQKFSENILANTQSYASSFENIGNVVGDISRIESDKSSQAEHQVQEVDNNEAQQEVDFRETMRKIREYQEQQQHQDAEDDILSDEYLGNYVDTPSLDQEEPDGYHDEGEPVEHYDEVEHYSEDEPDGYYSEGELVERYSEGGLLERYNEDGFIEHYHEGELVDQHEGEDIYLESAESEESDGTKNRYTSLDYAKEESVAYKLGSILRDIKAQGHTIDSIVVNDPNLKDHVLENERVIINKDSIIVMEDLEESFAVRYADAENKVYEVVQ